MFCACRSGLQDGAFYKGPNRYNLGPQPTGFRRLDLRGNDLAFLAHGSPHSIAVNSTCDNYEDAPLEVLTNHLLMGFTDRVKVSQELGRMDGRESLHSHIRARMDGVPVELFLVVLKKNGCIYDFTYLAPVGRFDEHFQTFWAFIHPFHAEAI
jgi:hypothetical protein